MIVKLDEAMEKVKPDFERRYKERVTDKDKGGGSEEEEKHQHMGLVDWEKTGKEVTSNHDTSNIDAAHGKVSSK